ncbi:hypothetical protein RFI_22099 [Reticulomyxa filosa]|uniref:TRAF-type domain-containing protein n=1 Tax=Reticulomyxa filosa TaxID=46433 RepID=X6MQ93_RETFI|nr:hypothetical protein RFI_22099 [Reticulomyxa filosa]|eukprot:ETO15265.1 hypothetical protein RFI_22099 [Reticulomyxa filosa]
MFGSKYSSNSNKDDTSTILGECYDLNWLVDSSHSTQERYKDFLCRICHKIANNALELCCKEHEKNDEAYIVGESCLQRYLKENNGKCPITNHNSCDFQKSVSIRKQISKIQVLCPRQYQITVSNTSSIRSAKQLLSAMNFKKLSGTTDLNCSDKECSFKGSVKDLEHHLLKECSLSRTKCEFYEYGCSEALEPQQVASHNQSNMAEHLQMVMAELKKRPSKKSDTSHSSNGNDNGSSNGNENNLLEEIKKLRILLNDKDKTIEQLKQTIEQLQQSNNNNNSKKTHSRKESKNMKVDTSENNNNNNDNNKLKDTVKGLFGNNAMSPLATMSSANEEKDKRELSYLSCEDMVRTLRASDYLENGKDYLLVEKSNTKIQMKNKEWNEYKYGIFLLGKNIEITCDCANEGLGHLRIRCSHLLLANDTCVIHCNGLGFKSMKGPGHGKLGAGGGYGTKGTGKQGGKSYGEETLLKEIYFGSGGGVPVMGTGGGNGGGIIELVITQHFVNYGKIQCNGLDGSDYLGGGGGSGGSILIKVVNEKNNFKHVTGTLQCLGGNPNTSWREGGVGRIAIYGFALQPKDLEHITPIPYHKPFIIQ